MRLLVMTLLVFISLMPRLRAQEMNTLSSGLRKLAGVEPTQGIAFARIFLEGTRVAPGAPVGAEPLQGMADPPVLIAQCTRSSAGKFRFEVMMNFGGVADTSYHPPWRSTGPDDVFPPHTDKTTMTFEFFGYTRVKPVKRSWEILLSPYGEMRYDPPGGGSRNMEEVNLLYAVSQGTPHTSHYTRKCCCTVRNDSDACCDTQRPTLLGERRLT